MARWRRKRGGKRQRTDRPYLAMREAHEQRIPRARQRDRYARDADVLGGERAHVLLERDALEDRAVAVQKQQDLRTARTKRASRIVHIGTRAQQCARTHARTQCAHTHARAHLHAQARLKGIIPSHVSAVW